MDQFPIELDQRPLFDPTELETLAEEVDPTRIARMIRTQLTWSAKIGAQLPALAAAGDGAGVGRLAHQIAGSAPAFGLSRLTLLAQYLEREAVRLGGAELSDATLRFQSLIEASGTALAGHPLARENN